MQYFAIYKPKKPIMVYRAAKLKDDEDIVAGLTIGRAAITLTSETLVVPIGDLFGFTILKCQASDREALKFGDLLAVHDGTCPWNDHFEYVAG